MSQLAIPRGYADGEVLTQAHLDDANDSIETFVNVTKINDDNIQTSGITGSTKLLNASVTNAKIANSAIDTNKLANDAVTTDKILDANVTTDKIDDDAVTVDKIDDAAIDEVTLEKTTDIHVKDGGIGTDQLADDAVTNAKVADDAINNDQIVDGAVSPEKQSTYYAIATVSTDASWTNGETKTLANIPTHGRPVRVSIINGLLTLATGSNTLSASLQYSSDNSSWSSVRTVYSASTVNLDTATTHNFGTAMADSVDPAVATNQQISVNMGCPVIFVHIPTAGTAYYRLIASVSAGSFAITTALTALIEEL